MQSHSSRRTRPRNIPTVLGYLRMNKNNSYVTSLPRQPRSIFDQSPPFATRLTLATSTRRRSTATMYQRHSPYCSHTIVIHVHLLLWSTNHHPQLPIVSTSAATTPPPRLPNTNYTKNETSFDDRGIDDDDCRYPDPSHHECRQASHERDACRVHVSSEMYISNSGDHQGTHHEPRIS